MRRIGFSTGAIAKGDYLRALDTLRGHRVDAVELSALRVNELEPLCQAIPTLELSTFSFISIHAPSKFTPDEEPWVIEQLSSIGRFGFPIVVHPDTLFTPQAWARFGDRLLIENMDKRKPVGRTVAELESFFTLLPAAGFCFDVGHARQVDPSMTQAALLLRAFEARLGEVHMSEVNTASRHDPISGNAVLAFRPIANWINPDVPIILESLIDQGQSDIPTELRRANEVFTMVAAA